MSVQVLQIERKIRSDPLWPVGLADFETTPAGSVAPAILTDEPTITPYSLDHANRQAVFVETPAGVDLSQAPFYYQWQYEHARRLFVAPYTLLYDLTQASDNRGENLIFIHSTGRCGSTLFSHALNRAPSVISLSEPDIYTLLVGLRNSHSSDDTEVSHLICALTLLLCKPTPVKTQPTHWAVKFRSMALEIGDLLYAQFPQAKTVFLYRNAESWARSMTNAFRIFDPAMAPLIAAYHQVLTQWMPLMQTYATPGQGTMATQLLGTLWLSLLQRYLELHERGVPMGALRYEDLKAAPAVMLAAIFAYCGLPRVDLQDVMAVFDEDSQRGTVLSQEQANQNSYPLTEDHLAEIRTLLQAQPVLNRADISVPNTLLRRQ
jgi:hypothetical protein